MPYECGGVGGWRSAYVSPPRDAVPMLGPGSFGHSGAGGRLGHVHPERAAAVAYVCTRMAWDPTAGPDPCWLEWTTALHAALSRRGG
ncbi:hypothetical protein AB0L10_25720 [Streptomyces flaveolus]|uniref:hypothetical protein n=1 Tax=Streptomyces flaveolus TaxID=67297 RepID=UPI0034265410